MKGVLIMKKCYSKPEIMFEDFAMSTNIASGCTLKIEGHSSGTCPYVVKNEFTTSNIFTSAYSVCTTKEDDGEYNGVCYHTFEATATLFNS